MLTADPVRPLDKKRWQHSAIHQTWTLAALCCGKDSPGQKLCEQDDGGVRSMQPLRLQWVRSACEFIDFKRCIIAAWGLRPALHSVVVQQYVQK